MNAIKGKIASGFLRLLRSLECRTHHGSYRKEKKERGQVGLKNVAISWKKKKRFPKTVRWENILRFLVLAWLLAIIISNPRRNRQWPWGHRVPPESTNGRQLPSRWYYNGGMGSNFLFLLPEIKFKKNHKKIFT